MIVGLAVDWKIFSNFPQMSVRGRNVHLFDEIDENRSLNIRLGKVPFHLSETSIGVSDVPVHGSVKRALLRLIFIGAVGVNFATSVILAAAGRDPGDFVKKQAAANLMKSLRIGSLK